MVIKYLLNRADFLLWNRQIWLQPSPVSGIDGEGTAAEFGVCDGWETPRRRIQEGGSDE